MKIAIISGSGFYDFDEIVGKQIKKIETPFGVVEVETGSIHNVELVFISRHGKKHKLLSNMINHKANIYACKESGVNAIIATTICGITNSKLELGTPLIFSDIFYLDNRLPNGEVCTFYIKEGDKERGHYIFSNPFSQITVNLENEITKNLTYGSVNGPRFNSKSEIKYLKNYCDAISQTSGPETILAGELEIPYILLGFGVDYANGIKEIPTPIEELNKNMVKSKEVFKDLILKIVKFAKTKDDIPFSNFVYRFE